MGGGHEQRFRRKNEQKACHKDGRRPAPLEGESTMVRRDNHLDLEKQELVPQGL